MKISVDRQILCEAVTHLSRAASSRSSLPVLEGIYIRAEQDRLFMSAYNLEMAINKTIEAKVEEEGESVINARLLLDILRKTEGDTVLIDVNDRYMCHIESLTSVFDILGMPATDYPEIPKVEQNEEIVLPADILQDMVRQTIFAAASEGAKPILTGLVFNFQPDTLMMIAVDGYRLAVRKEAVKCNINAHFVVPARVVGEAVRIIDSSEGDVKMAVGNRHIAIESDGYTIISRLIEGESINYKNTVPSEFSCKIKVSPRDIVTILDRISLLISEDIKNPVRCIIGEEEITFSCATSRGRSIDYYKVKPEGAPFEIGFNSRFLADALKATEAEEVYMNFNGPFAPMVISPAEGDGFVYMVMPMRLNNNM